MPGNAPPETDETELLLAYLRQQRDGLRYAAFGLSEEQLRTASTSSSLTVGGLLKHVAATEADWARCLVAPGTAAAAGDYDDQDEAAYTDSFAVGEEDTAESLLARMDAVAAATEAAVRALTPATPVTLPENPWIPQGDGYTVRWVLLHLLEELARHAGHADLVREHLDGATMFALMAGAEGWPASEWITPWTPPADDEGAAG